MSVLLPHLAATIVDGIEVSCGSVSIGVHARSEAATCPRCGQESTRVHSRYRRRLADAAIGGQPVQIRPTVRRFFCGNAACEAVTFVEQVAGLTVRYGRRTGLLQAMLEQVGLALAGRAGARLAARLGLSVSRSSLLRLVRALPDPAVETVPVLGVDDFAVRRSQRYGTVLVDMDTRRPVDVLEDRDAEGFVSWLRAHPGTEVICRDRAGAYAEGGRDGAPAAIQVADRWHLWHNLGSHVEKTVTAHRACLREPVEEETPPAPPEEDTGTEPTEPNAEPRLVARTRERYTTVQHLAAQGCSISAMARQLGLDRHTVRRFARADNLDELLAKTTSRGALLDEFKPYLHRRFNAGVTDAAALCTEIRAEGYRGSVQTVRRYLRPFRGTRTAPPPVPAPPKVRHLTGWIMSDPDTLDDEAQVHLKDARARCSHLDALAGHVTEFAKMLTGRHGDRLEDWIADVDADDLPALRSFTAGLKTDYAAVLNALTLEHNSGGVEGHVNRIKMLKRQMYGRAKFDLLPVD
ncbi:MAG: ISL3 family transposase [Streptosporangiales bacterium]